MPHREKIGFVPIPGPTTTLARMKVVEFFAKVKTVSKAKSAAAEVALTGALALPGAVPPKLRAFEQAHLEAKRTWLDIAGSLKAKLHKYRVSLATVPGQPNQRLVQVPDFTNVAPGTPPITLGTIYLNDARFAARAAIPTLFYRQESPTRDYVHVASAHHAGTYLRRFVTRGLSHADAYNLDRGNPLSAAHPPAAPVVAVADEVSAGHPNRHPVLIGTALNEQQQILSHTRGWHKRYISAGITQTEVVSTRGTVFRSVYGAAVIDLHQVLPASIFDLHRAETAMAWFGLSTAGMIAAAAAPPAGYAGEEYLALCDVIRTREVLIKNTVPLAAVGFGVTAPVLVGFGSNSIPNRDSWWNFLVAHAGIDANSLAASHDELSYSWNPTGASHQRWRFLEYNTAADAQVAYTAITAAAAAVTSLHASAKAFLPVGVAPVLIAAAGPAAAATVAPGKANYITAVGAGAATRPAVAPPPGPIAAGPASIATVLGGTGQNSLKTYSARVAVEAALAARGLPAPMGPLPAPAPGGQFSAIVLNKYAVPAPLPATM